MPNQIDQLAALLVKAHDEGFNMRYDELEDFARWLHERGVGIRDIKPSDAAVEASDLNWRIHFNVSGGWWAQCWHPETAYAYDETENAANGRGGSMASAVTKATAAYRAEREVDDE